MLFHLHTTRVIYTLKHDNRKHHLQPALLIHTEDLAP